ncbi:MAG: nitroreductase family protein [Tepidiformaceae bacterium]|tara:strand:- start:538 stop:1215 length:678 start_codon:yes stop_codon:yes gene_type:complete
MPRSEDPGFFETIYSARALRRFSERIVEDDVIFQVLDAAIRAPSGGNAQDWRFVVVKDQSKKKKMQEWAEEGWASYQSRFAKNNDEARNLPRAQRLPYLAASHLVEHLAEAPVIIVVTGEKDRHQFSGGSTFPAIQNILLAARALGLGGSIFNMPMIRHKEDLSELLGIPVNYEVVCIVPLGYPTDRHGPLKRKPVHEVVFIDDFGKTWDFASEQPENGWENLWL